MNGWADVKVLHVLKGGGMEEANSGIVLDGHPHSITNTDHLCYFTLLARVHYEGSLQYERDKHRVNAHYSALPLPTFFPTQERPCSQLNSQPVR